MTRLSRLLAAASLIALPLLAGPAFATSVTLTYPGTGGEFLYGSESVTVYSGSSTPAVSNESGTAGALNATISAPVGGLASPAIFWCTNLAASLVSSASYTVESLTSSPYSYPAPTATKIAQATALVQNGDNVILNSSALTSLNTALSTSYTLTQASAAVQIALWAILYDTVSTGYNVLTNQGFYVTNTDAGTTSLANSLLNYVSGGTWKATSTASLISFNPGTSDQSFTALAIPEPASMTLFASGIAGLIATRRRRRKA